MPSSPRWPMAPCAAVSCDHRAPASSSPGGDDAPLGYAEALAELEAILAELDGETIDVDLLATKVQRAAELIETCRARIESARMEVTRVVAAMAPDRDPDGQSV